MECCGIKSLAQGFRDWQLNEQFACNETNPFPERCGVPFSCCKKAVMSESLAGGLASRSVRCWQKALSRAPHELEAELNTRGCLVPLKQAFERSAIVIVAGLALVMVLGVSDQKFRGSANQLSSSRRARSCPVLPVSARPSSPDGLRRNFGRGRALLPTFVERGVPKTDVDQF